MRQCCGGYRAHVLAWRVTTLLIAVATFLAACTGPSRSTSDYREKAANSAQAMRSAVQTVRLVAEAALDGRAPSRYTALVVSEAEHDGDSIASAFSSVQPPSRDADTLRARTTQLLDDSVATLAELRIAVRRHDSARIGALSADLVRLSERLERLSRITST